MSGCTLSPYIYPYARGVAQHAKSTSQFSLAFLGVYLGAPIISQRRKAEESHPVSTGPTSAWRQFPFLLTSIAHKELLRTSDALSAVHVYALTGTSNSRAGSVSSGGSACRFTTWSWKGVVGTLGMYLGRGLRTT